MRDWAAIEKGVWLRFGDNIQLHQGVYLDEGVYLNAAPNGIEIVANTIVMHCTILHVYNFRGTPYRGENDPVLRAFINICAGSLKP